jgi:GT2 family glycosyltransferase
MFNAALAAADGEFILPLPSDATLPASALYELAAAIDNDPDVDMLYTDEDRLTEANERCAPRFKTGWDPDLALGRDAVGLLAAYRTELLLRLGGMSPDLTGLALPLYDLSLKAGFAAPPGRIRHVPAVLCHRSGLPDWDAEGARTVVRKHLAGDGVHASVVPAALCRGWSQIVRQVAEPAPLVSVIVPTRDRAELLARIADGVLHRTDYPALELIVADNDSQEAAALGLLERLSADKRVSILSYAGPFNFAALNNHAAHSAQGDIIVLLNNDIDVVDPGWLRELVSHAVRPDVGAVGAKLLYPDGRVQHGGVVLCPEIWPVHQLRFADRLDPGPLGELALTRTVSAVTGACLALRREVFFAVGGLNEDLRVVFNDIDLCMRLADHGYRIVWTPFAELVHLEAASRGDDGASPGKLARATQEAAYFGRFWKSLLPADPFHNPNISYGWDTLVLAEPPRRRRPWLM